MSDSQRARIVAWARELRAVHDRLRDALEVAREEAHGDDSSHEAGAQDAAGAPGGMRDLLLYCHGFCVALRRHHRGEDTLLFPAIAKEHPELRDTLRALQQDHSMIDHLVAGLQEAVDSADPPQVLSRHLEGLSAIMESHFRYEERALLRVLGTLELDAEVEDVLGPL